MKFIIILNKVFNSFIFNTLKLVFYPISTLGKHFFLHGNLVLSKLISNVAYRFKTTKRKCSNY